MFESRSVVPVNFPAAKLRRAFAAVWVAELFGDRHDAHPDQDLGNGVMVHERLDEFAGDGDLGEVRYRAGGETGHRAFRQDR